MRAPFFQNLNASVLNRKMSVWAAAEIGDWDSVKAAVENGADIEERGGVLKRTALHYACLYGHTSVAEYLMKCSAEVNSRDKVGSLPIHYACGWKGHLDAVKLLIGKGSDFTSTNDVGQTPLHIASLNDNDAIVDYLVQVCARHEHQEETGNYHVF